MSAGRRVLRVAADGSADFRCVQHAVDAVPLGNRVRTVITVAPGVYRECVYVAKTKNLITLAAAAPESTVISWDNTATSIRHHQPESVIGKGTFACGTFIVEGEDFIAENITFENNAPQGSGQAVALRATADRCTFYNCRFLGWQDTLYLHYGKQYLRDCYIEGSVDFIFGNSTALFEHCHVHCKSAGFITAQSRNTPQESTGYVFLRCVITGRSGPSYAYLGRPWRPYARVVFAYTYMDCCIQPVGWSKWDNTSENEKTASFYEYRCWGAGCCVSDRVPWSRQLGNEEAVPFLSHAFIDPNPSKPWLQQTSHQNLGLHLHASPTELPARTQLRTGAAPTPATRSTAFPDHLSHLRYTCATIFSHQLDSNFGRKQSSLLSPRSRVPPAKKSCQSMAAAVGIGHSPHCFPVNPATPARRRRPAVRAAVRGENVRARHHFTSETFVHESPAATIDDYLHERHRIVRAFFPDSRALARLSDEEWRIHLAPVHFLFLTAEPVVTMRVAVSSDKNRFPATVPSTATTVLHLHTTNCELHGVEDGERRPLRLDLAVSGAMYPHGRRGDGGARRSLKSDLEMSVRIAVLPAIALVPRPVLVGVGETILKTIAEGLQRDLRGGGGVGEDFNKFRRERLRKPPANAASMN